MSDLVVSVRPGAVGVEDAITRVRALFTSGRSVGLLPEHGSDAAFAGPEPDEPTLLLATSGSSGEARGVELGVETIRASARLAEEILGGSGLWLTAMPVTGAGGFNTVARSLLNGHDPIVWPGVAGASHFDGQSVLPSLRALRARADVLGLRAYASLVPTQVQRLVSFADADDSASVEALRALAALDAVLIGADALGATLRQTLHAYGIRVVTTYGATETCGGCIYDDRLFSGTSVDIIGDEPGRIAISGPTVARRYRDGAPELADGRWLSNDLGRWHLGRLEVIGRIDDLVKVGGQMVALPVIAQHIKALADVDDVVVLARDDDEWGHVPIAFLVGCSTPDALVRQYAAAAIGRRSAPLDLVRIDAIPLLPNGKPDRQQLLAKVQ